MEHTLSWVIDNFSEKNDEIRTANFSISGCEWCVCVHPKGASGSDHLCLYLQVVNPDSLSLGWKRRASYCFVLLNQSGKELFRSPEESRCTLFCSEILSWGYYKTLPLSKLQEKGFLKKNKLTIKIYIKVLEVVHQGKSTENEMLDYGGFQIPASQLALLTKNVIIHDPNFAVDIVLENQAVNTKYRNLLRIVETLSKPPQSLSLAQLCNAQSEVNALEEAGFKLDWLNSKIEELSVECKKEPLSDGSRVRQLEDRVNNVELTLSDLKAELDREKIKSAAAAAAAAKVSSFQFIDFIIKRFFLTCFSFSKY
ncbi:PREDICTED: MATH domain and coiled-coil domain-containing protein At2g42465-like [Brassica oleracea var. oleracea]|uniref:MATH domain and coiled-coil domain-containing protein At2g42465-like n=1 Tax=Brassica oleracea var. oleracea TaxID=109376 RepID=UPI0006A727CA|nr:PREDICTED: MATH domain and coiled-coil domain-containing protein At2g42465-like [Brassica oleracea var. oleracea]